MQRSTSLRRRRRRKSILLFAITLFSLLLLFSIFLIHSQLSSPNQTNPQIPNFRSRNEVGIEDFPNSDLGSDEPIELIGNSDQGLFWDHSSGVIRRSLGVPVVNHDHDHEIKMEIGFDCDDQPIISEKSDQKRWVSWFEAKGRFLKQDLMFRSGLDLMNHKNDPLFQDPDGDSLMGLSRIDRLLKKKILNDITLAKRKVLGLESKKLRNLRRNYFSDFVGGFFDGGDCSSRVFMVWNNPAWAFGVRYRRSVESLLYHHRDACVMVFSETLELDFFADFVRDGFKVAVAMPNLDELLEATPVHEFAREWFEWRKTKYYPLHYSELLRLAALYKYGGIYLDWDMIVLKPLTSLKNAVGIENEINGYPVLNGAVMAFDRESPFLLECMKEFHATYDSDSQSWNGNQLLTRTLRKLSAKGDKVQKEFPINIEPTHKFFPISHEDIIRYFSAPEDEAEEARQSILLTKILNESKAFHFWNSSTYSLVPQAGSLSEKIINMYCLMCTYIL